MDFLGRVQYIYGNSRVIITAMHSGDEVDKRADVEHLDTATILFTILEPREDLYR